MICYSQHVVIVAVNMCKITVIPITLGLPHVLKRHERAIRPISKTMHVYPDQYKNYTTLNTKTKNKCQDQNRDRKHINH